MKFKLDENLDVRLVPLLAEGGNHVDTVKEEGLSGFRDEEIHEACVQNRRTLITLDLDFSNPFRYPPGPTEGIVVLRPVRPVLSLVQKTLENALPALKRANLKGKLWVVEPGRIRKYEPRPSA